MSMTSFDCCSSSSSSSRTSTRVTWFVAVSEESKKSESVLRWALDDIKDLGGTEICILHVHRPDKYIVTGMGRFPIATAEERQINSHREIERAKLSKKLDKYLQICQQRRVTARKIYVEMDSVEEGIVKLLKENEAGKLVIGASSVRTNRAGMTEIRPERSNYVNKHAPSYVQIWFIGDKLLYTREATVRPEGNEQGWAPSPPQEVSRTPSARSSVGDQVAPEPEILNWIAPSAPHPPVNPSESDRHANINAWPLPMPPHLLPHSVSMPIDREAGGLYLADFERLRNEKDNIAEELKATRSEKWILESKVKKFDLKVKEMEQRLELSMHLEGNYKKDRDDMQRERDNAIRHVEEVRKQLNEGASSADSLMFCHKFTLSEIQEATNDFDPSRKIGEDAYGNIYKGVFHLTEVAVKIPHPDSSLASQDFRQEVEIMCKLRHPNIVNLIGICLESHALIYEHCAYGTLEDRLNNKDQGSPFPWQIRVRVASELCICLAFLHSHMPNPAIHGDLRPKNIHLASNYTCKLNGFRISKAISNGTFSLKSFYRGESEGHSYLYMDPEFLTGGDLTTKSDVYALGIILLRLLTRKPATKLAKQVQIAVESDRLSALLDPSAEWPLEQANQLVDLALRCCEMSQDRRPDLEEDVWNVLESMNGTIST